MNPQLIIPMTGISSRFTAAGYKLPKFLLDVEGQTVIEHVLDMFPDWNDVIFLCNELHLENKELNLEHLLKSKRPNAQIVKIANNTKGPGWALQYAKSLIDMSRPVVINYCDFTCYWDSNDLATELNSGNVDGCIPAYTGFHPHMEHSTSYAYLKISGNSVIDIQEKQPWTDNPNSEFASSGTYGFATGQLLFDALEEQISQDINLNGEYYLSLTYKPLLAAGKTISTLNVQHFMQWGTPQDFEEYKEYSRALKSWLLPRAGQFKNRNSFSRIVLASGAGSRFKDAGYTLAKPALPLSGKTLLDHSAQSIPGNETVVVTRSDLNDGGSVESFAKLVKARVVELKGMSRGQAESTLFGLREVKSNQPVIATSCDAISQASLEAVTNLFSEAGPNGLIVWASNPYFSAARKPEQYGWVKFDINKNATHSWIKKDPDIEGAGVIIGTFGFGSRDFAIEIIEYLMENGDAVNGEFYLDSLISHQINSGNPCKVLEVDSFVSVGTPSEYKSVLYWQSCFDKWALHPYKLVSDPMVEQQSVMYLSHKFREFSPRSKQIF